MEILILFYVFIVYIALLNLKLRNNFIKNGLLITLLLFSAFRREIGTDFRQYLDMQRLAYINIDYVYFEPFHKVIFYIGKLLSYDYTYFVLTSLFIFYFLIKILKDNKKISHEIVFFFITSGYYFYSFNGIRQFMSIIVFLYAIRYIEIKQLYKYFILIIFASTIHYSAIIMMFIPLILKFMKKVKWRNYILISIVFFLFTNYINVVLEIIIGYLPIINRYSTYFSLNSFDFKIIHFLERFALLVLMIFIFMGAKREEVNNSFYLFILGVLLRLLLPISVSRIALYLTMTQILLFPMFVNKEFKNARYLMYIVLIYSIILYSSFLVTNTSHILGF